MRKITLCNDFVELLLGCYKKVHIETYSLSKKKENLVMQEKEKKHQFLYLTKTVLKTTSKVIFNMKKSDLDKL